jgi:hypothetical protein
MTSEQNQEGDQLLVTRGRQAELTRRAAQTESAQQLDSDEGSPQHGR